MAVSIAKTENFTTGQISFSQIQAIYGGSATDVKASSYLRNVQTSIDWNGQNGASIIPRVPDAVENEGVPSTKSNWDVSDLRNTIKDYTVTQSGTDLELAYDDSDTVVWNGNLSRNILKTFDVTGTIYADSNLDDALTFSGNLYNLEIEVDELGEIYGEGAPVDEVGGDALYVNNTYTESKVEIRSYGKIWAGGGGGTQGATGSDGSDLSCYVNLTWTYGGSGGNNRNWSGAVSTSGCKNTGNRPVNTVTNNVVMYAVNPNSVRSRCRGGSYRRGQGWNSSNWNGYQCSPSWTGYCRGRENNTVIGGSGGAGGAGGQGKGWSNRNVSINASPHIGSGGSIGNTNSCAANGNNSTGATGATGASGGDWGTDSSYSSGSAVLKKNAIINYSTSNTIKGKIKNI